MEGNIKLSGGEITVIKTLGLSGAQVYGKILLEKLENLVEAEIIDTLESLVNGGFVLCSKVSFRNAQEIERA